MHDPKLLFLELNEINFDFIEKYTGHGELPNFRKLLDRHGVSTTTSETEYEELEPWIQWVTAHTGLSYEEHGIFRLGDIVDTDIPQIWEQVETMGFRVGAVSPMNAKFRMKDPAFFLPDPWTKTDTVAPLPFRRLNEAVSQAVNDNAQSRVTPKSMIDLLFGTTLAAAPGNLTSYMRYVAQAKAKPWNKPLFLDRLLADLFIKLVRSKKADFATLFLNAGAHIQHHYLFSSRSYEGTFRNPEWYVKPGEDPILDVYRLYDEILADVQKTFPNTRIMLATGLRQVAYHKLTYYWRLKDHATFLTKLGIPFTAVEPRMSRDFVLKCADEVQARESERLLRSATLDGEPVFEVDNRGRDLFVMLVYPHEITEASTVQIGNQHHENFKADVAFVAIKNGEHSGDGYFVDTGMIAGDEDIFPLKQTPQRIMAAMNG